MAKCDNCKEKVEKTFKVDGVQGEYCTDCQQEIEVDIMENQAYELMQDW